jgi:hypothetical protein
MGRNMPLAPRREQLQRRAAACTKLQIRVFGE